MSSSNSNNQKEDNMFKMYYQTLLDGKKPTRSRVSTKNDLNSNNNMNEISLELNTSSKFKDNDPKLEIKISNTSKKRKILKKKINKKNNNLKDTKEKTRSKSAKKKKIKIVCAEESLQNSINNSNYLTEQKISKEREHKILYSIKNKNNSLKLKTHKKFILNKNSDIKNNEISQINNKSLISKNSLDNIEVVLDYQQSLYNTKEEKDYLNTEIIQENEFESFELLNICSDKVKIFPYSAPNIYSNEILPMKLEEKILYNLALPKENYLNRYIVFIKSSRPILGKIIKIIYDEGLSNEIDGKIEKNSLDKEYNIKNNKISNAIGFEVLVLNKDNDFLILNLFNSFGRTEDINCANIIEKFNFISTEVIEIELSDLDYFEISNIYVIEQIFITKKYSKYFNKSQSSELNQPDTFDDLYENLYAVVSKIVDKNSDVVDENIIDNFIQNQQDNKIAKKKSGYNYLGLFLSKIFQVKENNPKIGYLNWNNYDYTDYSLDKFFEIFHETDLEPLNYSYITNAYNIMYNNFPNNSKIPRLFSNDDKLYCDLIAFSSVILNVSNNFSPRDKKCLNNLFLSIILNEEYLIFLKKVEFHENNLISLTKGQDDKIAQAKNKITDNNKKMNNLISSLDHQKLNLYPAYLFKIQFLNSPEKFIFHEALIKTKLSENYCLILNYYKKSESIYVRYYKNGCSKWLYLNKIDKNDEFIEEIYINKCKGAADRNTYFRQIVNYFSTNNKTNKLIINDQSNLVILQNNKINDATGNDEQFKNICNFYFYKKLKFFIHFYSEEKILQSKKYINSTSLILKKKGENNFNLLKDLECLTCTYPITDVDYRLCRFCRKIYHDCCLPSEEKGLEPEKNIFGITNYFWSCKECKVCNICLTNSQINSKQKGDSNLMFQLHSYSKNKKMFSYPKLICKVCFNANHYECLPAYIKKIYPHIINEANQINSNFQTSYNAISNFNVNSSNIDQTKILENFKCEKCIKCISCKKTNLDLSPGITWSEDFEFCSECKKRYEKKEFCPICKKLWMLNETKMVQCKCKFWVHLSCDRFLTEETFKKLSEKKSQNYHCPICRIKKKIKLIERFIDDCVILDKNGWFFYPVDTIKEINYLKIVKNPISFSVIKTKALQGVYLENPDELINDIKLIFSNAMNYNFPNSKIHKEANFLNEECLKLFEENSNLLTQIALEYFLYDRNTPILYLKNSSVCEFDLKEAKAVTFFIEKVYSLLKLAGYINSNISNLYLANGPVIKYEYLNYLFLIEPIISNNYIYFPHNPKIYLKYNEKRIREIFGNKYNLFNTTILSNKISDSKLAVSKITKEKLNIINNNYNSNSANNNCSETESKNSDKLFPLKKQQSEISLEVYNNTFNENTYKENNSIRINYGEETIQNHLDLLKFSSINSNLNTKNNLFLNEDSGKFNDVIKKKAEVAYNEENNIKQNNLNYDNYAIDAEIKKEESIGKLVEKSKSSENSDLDIDAIDDLSLNEKNIEGEFERENVLEKREKNNGDFATDQINSKIIYINNTDIEADKLININALHQEGCEIHKETALDLLEIDEKQIEKKSNVQKSTLRNQAKSKTLGKNNDFQHELDIYNSNFDIALNKKNQKSLKNAINKIQFNENNNDINQMNNSEDKYKNEDRLINLFNYYKEKDYKSSFLFINKAKRNLNDNRAYLEYIELMDYVVVCKDENRRKKIIQANSYNNNSCSNDKKDLKGNRKNSISPDSNLDVDDVDFNLEKKKTEKPKKGRPKSNKNETIHTNLNELKLINKDKNIDVNNNENQNIFVNSDILIKNENNSHLLGHKTKKPISDNESTSNNYFTQNKTNNILNNSDIYNRNQCPSQSVKLKSNSTLNPNHNLLNDKIQTGTNLLNIASSNSHSNFNLNNKDIQNQFYFNNNTEFSVSNYSSNANANFKNKNNNNSNLKDLRVEKKGSLAGCDRKMPSELENREEFSEYKNFSNNFCLPALTYINNLELILEPSCLTCGSFDDRNLMINCSCCRENFHSYCISNSENITNNIEIIKKYNWKCSKCKICEKCEINNNEISLLYCDSCDRAYHINCLDVPLNVVPESGWKCLNCFKCQNCESDSYYRNSFILSKNKDYSIFTRNFNYCFECGMRLFYQSLCAKCEISHFKILSKNLVYMKNREDYEKKKHLINDNSLIMLKCNICQSWFHSKCLGFDEKNVSFYFESYFEFNCLDCYLSEKYKERYMEVTFAKYLEVLKMSYIVMCFSKLMMIILRSISKDSNIKLHSKLLKAFLKENYHTLLKDKNICMLLELIRMDIFILKDKEASIKKKKIDNFINNSINNEKLKSIVKPDEKENLCNLQVEEKEDQHEKKEEIDYNINYKYIKPEILSFDEQLKLNEMMCKFDQEKASEKRNVMNISQEAITDIIRKIESERNSKIFLKLKRKNLFIFDIKNSKNNFKNNKFLTNSINSTEEITSIVESALSKEKDYVLDLNEKVEENKDENLEFQNLQSNNNQNNDIMKNNNDENQEREINEKENEEKKRDYINRNYDDKNFTRKYRIKLKAEKMLNKELKTFCETNQEINNSEILNMDNLVNFYEFDLDKYYSINNLIITTDKNKNILFDKCHINNSNHISTNILAIERNLSNNNCNNNLEDFDNNNNEIKEKLKSNNLSQSCYNNYISCDYNNKNSINPSNYNSFINKVLEKIRSYLKLENFSNKIRKFILDLILRSIIILKTSLLKWLINQILNNTDSNTNYINKNNLFFEWININDKFVFEHQIINSENTQDLTEEDIIKFLDYIDPIELSVTSKLLTCEFCGRGGPRKVSGRLIHLKNEMWGHVNCTIKSRGVFETADGNLINVPQILNKIKSYKCYLCRKFGATIICEYKKCAKNYHFACALAKQSVFAKSGKFFCLKCSNSKEDALTSFDTKRRIVVVKNNEFINDTRFNYLLDYNFNKFLPKYLVGSIVKFGNTSILKFFNLNRKELLVENYDINIIKLVDGFIEPYNKIQEFKNKEESEIGDSDIINILEEKVVNLEKIKDNEVNNLKEGEGKESEDDLHEIEQEKKRNKNEEKINENIEQANNIDKEEEYLEKSIKNVINLNTQKNDQIENDSLHLKHNKNMKFLLIQINENGFCLSEIERLTINDLTSLFSKYKILNNFEKTDFILNTENESFNGENISKRIKQVFNVQTEKIISLSPSKDNFETLMKNTINKFNEKLEFYVDNRILSDNEKKMALKINRAFDWMSFFNVFVPFNLLLTNFTQYSKNVLEYSDCLNNQLQTSDSLELKFNKKDNKSKLDFFTNIIKTKNINEYECFRQIDYINHHRELKLTKKNVFGLEDLSFKATDKRISKFNKQSYKNLERTMSTNIMDTDLPLAMKFRNYKALKTKVTIGPSTIHRNGLFALQGFQPGEIVIEYVGELITNKIADYREMEYNFKGFGDCYMFRLDKDQIIDATKYGNLARFINHCCDPNCSAQVNSILDKKHIILYAKRAIKPNEEITYDYNFECEEEKIQCRCGAKNCQGRLN